jgi:hypothetical protein
MYAVMYTEFCCANTYRCPILYLVDTVYFVWWTQCTLFGLGKGVWSPVISLVAWHSVCLLWIHYQMRYPQVNAEGDASPSCRMESFRYEAAPIIISVILPWYYHVWDRNRTIPLGRYSSLVDSDHGVFFIIIIKRPVDLPWFHPVQNFHCSTRTSSVYTSLFYEVDWIKADSWRPFP